MDRYSLKHNKRRKAPFGTQEAATLAAAGIQAAASIAGATMQKKAAEKAAEEQAKAIEAQAQIQADSAQQINDTNNRLQEQSKEFTKQQNEEARDLQKQAIMNQQMMMGQENSRQRAESAMIVARYGSNARRKLKNTKAKVEVEKGEIVKGGYVPSTGELMFGVTDGAQGLKNPLHVLEYRPDGTAIVLVDRRLKNHGERNSDGKEGVGLAGDVREIISKRQLPGTNFDPAEQYLATGDFDGVFNTQQNIKAIEGIDDEGHKKDKPARRRKLAGGLGSVPTDNLAYNQQPNLNTDTMTQVIAGDMYATKNSAVPEDANTDNGQLNSEDLSKTNVMAKYGKRIKLKCGGRPKADYGDQLARSNAWANFGGAAITSLGNIGSGIITNIGNNKAAGILKKANNAATNILVDAYGKMHGIDSNIISRQDYEAPTALAAIRSARVNVNPQITGLDRTRNSLARGIKQNTLSSAAQQQRFNELSDKTIQQKNEVYANQANLSEQIKQQNAQILTDVAKFNAQMKAQSIKDWTQAQLDIAKYNANVDNTKTQLIGEAQAGNFTSNAEIDANRLAANAQSWGDAMTTTATDWANAGNAYAKFRNDIHISTKAMDVKDREDYLRRVYGRRRNGKGKYSISKMDLPDNSSRAIGITPNTFNLPNVNAQGLTPYEYKILNSL